MTFFGMLNSSRTFPSDSIIPEPIRKWCFFVLGRRRFVDSGGASEVVAGLELAEFGSEGCVGPSEAVDRLVARDGALLAYLKRSFSMKILW